MKRFFSKLVMLIGMSFLCGLCCPSQTVACQVPVFRYAFERWNADRYRIQVLHEAPLTEDQQRALKTLRLSAKPSDAINPTAEVDLIRMDLPASLKRVDAKTKERWEKHRQSSKEPLVLVYYPRANRVGRELPVCETVLTTKSIRALLESPTRKKLIDRLQQGDAAVWLFVPCGRDNEDKAALKRLNDQLAADAQWIELPSAKEMEISPEVLGKVKVPLKVSFSTLTLKRDDPSEKFLLELLLNSEDDLRSFDQPMAFPVFGQGRVLYALIGKGIASDTIRNASSFIAGPCSCQVKNKNPGFDLLLQSDWKKAVGDVLISEPIESVDTEALAPKLIAIPPGRKSR